MLIIGPKEAESGNVSVRSRDTGETEEMSLEAFISKVQEEIRAKKN